MEVVKVARRLCISADSHVVEAPEMFAGLDQRFGEDAPKMIRLPSTVTRCTGDRSAGQHSKRLTSTERVVVIGGEGSRRENVAIGQPDVA